MKAPLCKHMSLGLAQQSLGMHLRRMERSLDFFHWIWESVSWLKFAPGARPREPDPRENGLNVTDVWVKNFDLGYLSLIFQSTGRVLPTSPSFLCYENWASYCPAHLTDSLTFYHLRYEEQASGFCQR